MDNQQLKILFAAATAIFSIAPLFILLYIIVYNNRKKRHIEEKKQMETAFESVLVKSQMEIREQTLQTIGAELHDNIGQLLSLTSLTLGSVESDTDEKVSTKIAAAVELTNDAIKELRQLGKLMQGEQLIGQGLRRAVQQEINRMEQSGYYHVSFSFADELTGSGHDDTDLVIFRIVQEALNNIIKHANADSISIEFLQQKGNIMLRIIDNGNGFSTDQTMEQGMGLMNMKKRVTILGGNLRILSSPNEGTTIEILIPYI